VGRTWFWDSATQLLCKDGGRIDACSTQIDTRAHALKVATQRMLERGRPPLPRVTRRTVVLPTKGQARSGLASRQLASRLTEKQHADPSRRILEER
jgi:hypothetical protein